MNTPFICDKYVTGKNFIGRTTDCNILGNLISQGENVVIYEPPKTGKMSTIQQTLINLRLSGKQFSAGEFSVLNIRTISSFLTRFGSTLLKIAASTPDGFSKIIDANLSGTHFNFDRNNYSETGNVISLGAEPDNHDIAAMMALPYRIAASTGQKIYLIIDEFQNLDLTEDGEKIFKAMEEAMLKAREDKEKDFAYILCGSMVNAMKSIFEVRKFFYGTIERVSLSKVDDKVIIEQVIKGFLSNGKVVEKELLMGVCKLFDNNLWYINSFVSICDYLSKGYIVETTLLDALDIMLSANEPRFMAVINDLTSFQLNLLKAVLDGYTKLSAADVIAKYELNSSANVKRLKDALVKKEIVTFDELDNPTVMDPLFKYWITKYFFEQKAEL
ncbi:MAG: hypothetical protein LKI59_05015 [Bacteroidales bacterium]|jgi:hypothetical protein|nr:hypothetical protein [Bacteroidales bacterium]